MKSAESRADERVTHEPDPGNAGVGIAQHDVISPQEWIPSAIFLLVNANSLADAHPGGWFSATTHKNTRQSAKDSLRFLLRLSKNPLASLHAPI